MSFATTDDQQEIYYEVHGTGPQTLVFVSGYFGVTHIWQNLIRQLSTQYRCIAYDSRGFGRSSKPPGAESYSVPRHAADLHTVLNACQATTDPSVLVTHSMGGNIGAAFYLAHPELVSGIVYSGTYVDGPHIQQRLTYEMLTSGVKSPSQCVDFYTAMGLDSTTALEAAKWPAHSRRHNGAALLAFDIGDRYASIKVPGLIVQGELDQATPPDISAQSIAEQMPRCHLEVLKGVRHFPPTEASLKMGKLVEDFVRDIPLA
ncbi:alpha/beta fold family hydrolase [Penicillium angulare]|uniref:Alpha/beta fold family hydrolase n=1 Tax=Penicillium angulare TaxID=116970 RepID=A0A9W9FAW1_9EURO|nr:alpha/beta fold family hydrolase [Penicillium angulare]